MRSIRILVLILAFAVLASCARSYTYRYRLTLTVDDNGVAHTGSSVVQVSETPGRGLDAAYPTVLRGQATVVDLGRGRLLIALLRTPTDGLLKLYDLPQNWRYGDASGLAHLKTQGGRVWELNPGVVSRLVTFSDISDPRTIRPVDAANLEATFGSGLKLKAAKIEVTSDEITTGLSRQLPWLALRRNYIDGGHSSFDSVGYTTDEFISGVQ